MITFTKNTENSIVMEMKIGTFAGALILGMNELLGVYFSDKKTLYELARSRFRSTRQHLNKASKTLAPDVTKSLTKQGLHNAALQLMIEYAAAMNNPARPVIPEDVPYMEKKYGVKQEGALYDGDGPDGATHGSDSETGE